MTLFTAQHAIEAARLPRAGEPIWCRIHDSANDDLADLYADYMPWDGGAVTGYFRHEEAQGDDPDPGVVFYVTRPVLMGLRVDGGTSANPKPTYLNRDEIDADLIATIEAEEIA